MMILVFSAYDIGFDAHRKLLLSNGSVFGKTVIMFGADMSSLAHIDNKKINIFILGKGPIDGLDDIKLNAEKEYSINFTE